MGLRSACQAGVVAVEMLEILTEGQDGREVKSIQRAKLGRVQVSRRFEDLIIEREECDRCQASPGAPDSQLPIAPRRASCLDDEQGAAEELSAGKRATQGSALGLRAHELDERRSVEIVGQAP